MSRADLVSLQDLDHSSLWLHVTNTLDEFAKMKAEKRESKL